MTQWEMFSIALIPISEFIKLLLLDQASTAEKMSMFGICIDKICKRGMILHVRVHVISSQFMAFEANKIQ